MEDEMETQKMIEDLESEVLRILFKKLTTEEYEKIKQIIQLEKNFKKELNYTKDRIKASRERADKYYDQYNNETRNSEKWRKYYEEVCIKYAHLEIELDIANLKIKELEGEKNE